MNAGKTSQTKSAVGASKRASTVRKASGSSQSAGASKGATRTASKASDSGVAGKAKSGVDRVSISKEAAGGDKKSGVNLDAWNTEKTAKGNPDLSASLGDKTLRRGMHDESVRSLQSALNNKLGKELATDGKFGPKTMAAVKEFQRKNNLKPDGIVGPKTKVALTGISPSGQAKIVLALASLDSS
jgi:murein L,D-transpeptidase YcbB/YkuD